MNAYAQAKHLFWKEYRTQRGLWIGLVGFCLLFHMVMKLSIKFHQDGDLEFMFASGYMTILFYALASTAMLYSAEREQGTDVLIRTMPLNKWLFLGTKLAWVVLSSLVGLVLFGMSAILWTRSFSPVIEYQVPNGLFIYVFVFLLAMLAPLIASLLTKQVLSSIGAAVVISFVMYWLSHVGGMYILDPFHPLHRASSVLYRDYYFFAMPVVLSIVSLELNRRWFRDSDFSWRWNWRLTRPKTLAVALEDAPYSSSWRLLTWKEWRSARLWLLSLFGLGFFFINLTHLGPGPYDTNNQFIHYAVNMCLLPLLAGFASCRRDQSQDEYRFYGNRGVSSVHILLSKHTVWMSGGFLVLLGLSLFVWMSPKSVELHRLNDFAGSLHLLPLSPNLLSESRVEYLRGSMIPAVQFWACLFFFYYALGHWCSISLKQPVISLLSSFFLAIFCGGIIVYYYSLEVPLFILTIVPSVVLFAISFIWGDDWIADRRERRNLTRPFWYGLLGLWTVITLLASWRVLEIPFSMTLDQTGLNNLSTRYMLFCLVGLLLVAAVLYVSDWLRSNFRTPAGKPVFVTPHDFRLGKLLVVSLFVHNLLLMSVNAGYGYLLNRVTLSADPSIAAIIEEQQNQLSKEDLFNQADKKIQSSLPPSTEEATNPYHTVDRAYLTWNTWAEVTTEQKQWLKKYRYLLPEFLAADESGVVHSTVMPRVPRLDEAILALPLGFSSRNQRLIHLARLEALRLEHDGRLEDAWQYHIAIVRYARRFAENTLPNVRWKVLEWVKYLSINHDLWRWMARQEQTPELLAQAAREFSLEIVELPPMYTAYQLQAEWTQQFDKTISTWTLLANGELMASLPWEQQRIKTLQQEQNRVALELSSRLASKNVSQVSIQLPPEYEQAYDFKATQSLGIFSGLSTLFLVKSEKNGDHDLLLVPANLSLSTALEEDKHLVWSRDALPAKYKTTEVLRAAPNQEPSNFGANNDIVRQIANELEFWKTYRTFLSYFAIYSYRAEKGAFPAALYELKGTKTEELFDPILPSVAVNTLEVEPDQLHWIAGILKQDATLESYKDDYQWFHAGKWPQSEYNLGDTPDLKPPTPLIAPKTKEVP